MNEFKELIGRKVKNLFLVVWPPYGEETDYQIDMSFGFVFNDKPGMLYIISTSQEDIWSPELRIEPLPVNCYSWTDFWERMRMWMNCEQNDNILDMEYYDVTESDWFKSIVPSRIKDIEFICIENDPPPFGIKVLFDNDYIISTPNSDGNTVETSKFNKNNNIKNFEKLGKTVFTQIKYNS